MKRSAVPFVRGRWDPMRRCSRLSSASAFAGGRARRRRGRCHHGPDSSLRAANQRTQHDGERRPRRAPSRSVAPWHRPRACGRRRSRGRTRSASRDAWDRDHGALTGSCDGRPCGGRRRARRSSRASWWTWTRSPGWPRAHSSAKRSPPLHRGVIAQRRRTAASGRKQERDNHRVDRSAPRTQRAITEGHRNFRAAGGV